MSGDVDVGKWKGVTAAGGTVTKLDWSKKGMMGAVPMALCKLGELCLLEMGYTFEVPEGLQGAEGADGERVEGWGGCVRWDLRRAILAVARCVGRKSFGGSEQGWLHGVQRLSATFATVESVWGCGGTY